MPSSKLDKFGIQQVCKGPIAIEEDYRAVISSDIALHQSPGTTELLHSDGGLTLKII